MYVQQGRITQLCGYNGRYPVVCCPSSKRPSNENVNDKYQSRKPGELSKKSKSNSVKLISLNHDHCTRFMYLFNICFCDLPQSNLYLYLKYYNDMISTSFAITFMQ